MKFAMVEEYGNSQLSLFLLQPTVVAINHSSLGFPEEKIQ